MATCQPPILPSKPFFLVDTGPCPGVYQDREAWERICAVKGFSINFEPFSPAVEIFSAGVKKDKPGFIVSIGGKYFIKRTARFGVSYGRVILTENRDEAKVWRREKNALTAWATITCRMAHGEKLPSGALEVEPE